MVTLCFGTYALSYYTIRKYYQIVIFSAVIHPFFPLKNMLWVKNMTELMKLWQSCKSSIRIPELVIDSLYEYLKGVILLVYFSDIREGSKRGTWETFPFCQAKERTIRIQRFEVVLQKVCVIHSEARGYKMPRTFKFSILYILTFC